MIRGVNGLVDKSRGRFLVMRRASLGMKETPSSNKEEPLLKSCPAFSMRQKASWKFG
jgi:hypothetical protein